MTENNLWLILVFILIATPITDYGTAYLSPISHLAEANPIYILANGFFLLVTAGFVAAILFLYHLKKALSLQMIFSLALAVLFLSYGHLSGTYSNIQSSQSFLDNYRYHSDDYIQQSPAELQPLLQQQNQQALYQYQKDHQEMLQSSNRIRQYFNITSLYALIPMLLSLGAFLIALKFHNARKPEREKIVDEIHKLSKRLQ